MITGRRPRSNPGDLTGVGTPGPGPDHREQEPMTTHQHPSTARADGAITALAALLAGFTPGAEQSQGADAVLDYWTTEVQAISAQACADLLLAMAADGILHLGPGDTTDNTDARGSAQLAEARECGHLLLEADTDQDDTR
jgi:hypothetical protein